MAARSTAVTSERAMGFMEDLLSGIRRSLFSTFGGPAATAFLDRGRRRR
jgi:hypothetical protein